MDVKTGVKKTTIETPEELPSNANVVGISLNHDGDFPAPATITIALTDENIEPGSTVYIYYQNDNGELQLINNGALTVSDDKTVTFTLNHASSYVFSTEPILAEDAADMVMSQIKKIDKVVYGNDAAIREARDAYDGFMKQYNGQDQEGLITNYDALQNAEKEYKALSDQVAAFTAATDSLYEDLADSSSPTMNYAQQKKMDELSAAYGKLNDDQKAALEANGYMSMYEDLIDVYEGTKTAEVVAQTVRVSILVAQLPTTATYSAADKSKIDAARNMYDSVVAETPAAKGDLKAELNKIQKAETEYRNAKRTAYNNASISLSTTQYTYNGKAKTPAVNGLSAFVNGRDYSVDYSNNVKTGKATVTVTAIGDCAGLSAKAATFRIVPAKAAISKLKKGKKSFKVTIKSQKKTGVSGYQISYSLKKNKKFKSTTTTKTSKTVKKLKAKKTYYVKVRAYKKIDGKKYYGAYSKVKKIKTK